MESSSSAKDVTQGAPAYFSNPSFFHEALRAIFKCLGVEISTQENSSSSEPKVDDKVSEASHQESCLTIEQGADPPSTTDTDPPSSTTDTLVVGLPSTTLEDAPLTVSLSAPPRPSVSTGSRPQINKHQLLQTLSSQIYCLLQFRMDS